MTGTSAPPPLEEADVMVLNTCCIRENADNKLYGALGRLKAVKAKRPDAAHRGGRLPRPEGPRTGPAAGRPRRRGVRHPQRAPGRRTHRPRPAARAGGGDPHRDGPGGCRGLPVGAAGAAGGGPLGLGDHPDRVRQQLHLLHRARGPRARDQPTVRRTRRRGSGPGRHRRERGHPAGPERQQLRPGPGPDAAGECQRQRQQDPRRRLVVVRAELAVRPAGPPPVRRPAPGCG